ncbi:MAG: YveK family protein, partial [Actinomycetota bacterium]
MALAAGSAFGFSSRITPIYTAESKVFVGPRSVPSDSAAGALQEFLYSKELVASYAEILKSRPLAEKVVEKTRAPVNASALVKRIKTRIIPETRLIQVTVQDPDPQSAQIYANEIV